MPQPDRTTLISLGPPGATADPSQRVLQAVRDAVQGEYEVLGELGRNAAGVTVFLARQLRVGSLVALRARPADGPAASKELWLDVMRQLDATMPGPREQCVNCNTAIGSWDRFCGHCGADLAGGGGDKGSADQMLQAVREAAGSRYEVIGAMDRADGGGDVYFARERRTGALTALRLKRDTTAGHGGAPQYLLGRTTVLKSVAESLGVSHGGPPPKPASPPPVSAAPPGVSPAAAPPSVPTPITPPPAPRTPGWQRLVLGVVVGGAAAALVAAFLMRRPATTSSSSASAGPVTPGATTADSVKVTVGGALPPGTIVTVDGGVVTPPTFSVATGMHRFRAVAPGYAAAVESLTLAAGQNLVWTPTIARTAAPSGGHHVASVAQAPPVAPPPATPVTTPVTPMTTPVTSAASVAPTTPPTSTASTGRNDSALALLPTTTSAPTCASLFSTLEWDRALPVCQREAAAGNVASQRTLGTLYDRGLGTHANPQQAAIWYARASDAGDRLAQYQFGALLREGTGVKADPKRAFDLFQKSAAQGDADAESALGTAYERGEGVKRDYTQAAQWYRKAADEGLAGAAYRLGALYERGEGVPKSDSAAVAWWTRAAAAGEPAARAELAKRVKH